MSAVLCACSLVVLTVLGEAEAASVESAIERVVTWLDAERVCVCVGRGRVCVFACLRV